MKVFKTLFLIVLMSFLLIQIEAFAHEGHLESDPIKSEKLVEKINIDEILSWLGNFHLILLHFPIALVCMVVIAELLFFWQKNPLYDNAGRFMLLAAAVMAIPTVLTGFAYGYNAQYEGVMASYFWWHRFFGILSVVLV
ncbi:MAG: hypothetical protein LLF94_01105, partial [Chlamydiales bacterium]|nr:hypothetical protein [Chlamydiales bacterium]